MLVGIYGGYHSLDLHRTFMDVAWMSTYSWGADDPLAQCISNFVNQLRNENVVVKYDREWSRKGMEWSNLVSPIYPVIFFISSWLNDEALTEILQAVEHGSHLAIISPSFGTVVRTEEIDEHKSFINKVAKVIGQEPILSRRLKYGLGAIFYYSGELINDLGIEPGPFGGPDENSVLHNLNDLQQIAKDLTTFEHPVIDCAIRSIPPSWPQDETLIIEIDVTSQTTVTIDHVRLQLDFHESLEPASSTEFDLYNLRPHSQRTVAALAIPRNRGSISNPLSLTVSHSEASTRIVLPDIQLSIALYFLVKA